jgi:hypothetical protein
MKRRDFFVAGGAIAATAGLAGAAAAATTSGTVTAQPKTTPTIFDFGARGDGTTDDSAAFSKALQVAAAEGRRIIVPGLTYAIRNTVTYKSAGDVPNQWGLEGQGATLKSFITNGADVVKLTSTHIVRYFVVSGITIRGTAKDGNGLNFSVPGTSGHIYNATIDKIAIENVGVDGLRMEGNVFENQISNSFFQDCRHNGATFAHYKGGICSSINIQGCYFNQNYKYGMEATNFDSQYGGASDVRVIGGYCRQNKSYGFRYNNGTAPGASVVNVGFENNCTSLSPGDPNGAHVYMAVRAILRDCAGYNESGGATFLLRGFFSDLALLDGCTQYAGGAMSASGKSRLVQVNGSNTGHVLMRGCGGGLTVVSGTKCTWQAENCSGLAPIGPFSIRSVSKSA